MKNFVVITLSENYGLHSSYTKLVQRSPFVLIQMATAKGKHLLTYSALRSKPLLDLSSNLQKYATTLVNWY